MNVAPASLELLQTLNMEEIASLQDLGWMISITPRALRAMVAEAHRHAPLETMGPIFMAGNVENGFRVELAAPAGPNAEHELLTSCANADFYNRWIKWSYDRHPKLWFTGQWHTHPFQDESMPSPWDIWGANQDRKAGWFGWCDEYFDGRGVLEIIMARKQTRAWWITTNPDRIHLVCEVDVGIGVPKWEGT